MKAKASLHSLLGMFKPTVNIKKLPKLSDQYYNVSLHGLIHGLDENIFSKKYTKKEDGYLFHMTNSTIISYIRFHKDVAFLHIKFRNETDWYPTALVDEAIFSLFYLLKNDGVTLVELLWSDSRNSLKMFSRERAAALKTLNIKCKTYPKEKTQNMSKIFGRETPYRGYNFHPIFGNKKL